MNSTDHAKWKKPTLEEWNALLINNAFELFAGKHSLEPLVIRANDLGTGDSNACGTPITEIDSYEPITIPPDIRPIGSKWEYKAKLNPDGPTKRHKVRLCPNFPPFEFY